MLVVLLNVTGLVCGNRVAEGKVLSVMTIKGVLRKIGERSATRTIEPRSRPLITFQPKLPAKIKVMIDKTNK